MPTVSWQNRAHFFAAAAQIMRHVLVDAARARGAKKRGGGVRMVPLDEARAAAAAGDVDLLALDDSLEALAQVDSRKTRVVELRYLAALNTEDTAEALRRPTAWNGLGLMA